MRHKFKKLPKTPVCQCNDSCKNPPLKGQPWCEEHKTSCSLGPVNGFEPLLEIDLWNTNYALRESHNCLAYALNNIDKELFNKCQTTPSCNVDFPQPGYESGYTQFSTNTKKCCADMVLRMEGDNPNIIPTTFSGICPRKMSKIALIVDPKRDYHYLRQDPDGKWSHKPGSLIVKRKDSTGRDILRPHRATFLYPSKSDPLFYIYFCGYYCVPRGKRLYMTTRVKKGGFSFSRKSMKTRRLKKKKNEPHL